MANVKIEKEDGYMGYHYVVTFNAMGIRCGYVEIPEDHPYYDIDNYDEIPIDCHGGLTFAGDRFDDGKYYIGFDCGHAGDAYDYDTVIKYFNDDIDVINRAKKMKDLEFNQYGSIKSIEYVENECRGIINQLIAEVKEDK